LIKQKELKELCDLIDFYHEHYSRRLSLLKTIYGVDDFEMSSRSRGVFRLFKTTRQIWGELLEFARRYDYDNDSTEWNIFDRGKNTISIVSRHDDNRFDSAYHSYILPEPEEYEFIPDLTYPDNNLWICWQAMGINDRKEYDFKNLWNAEDTYKFLTKKLIPKVIYDLEYRNKLFKPNFQKFLSTFNPNKYIGG
jgi:hypothetical protein